MLKKIWSICRVLGMTRFLTDDKFIRFQYRAMLGKRLRLNPPVDFNEKLQWLKVNDRQPEYTKLVDKIAVREHIACCDECKTKVVNMKEPYNEEKMLKRFRLRHCRGSLY